MKCKFSFAVVILSPCNCNNKRLCAIDDFDVGLLVCKWRMVEYAGGSVNALDTLSFYKNGKAVCTTETGEFTYHFITSNSLIIYNRDFGEPHYNILRLSGDNLIMKIRQQRIYADSIDKPVNGEIEKYIRITKK